MANLPVSLSHQGLSVDIAFGEPRPSFGDLVQICGYKNPRFPPAGSFGFEALGDLLFKQSDDYFGVATKAGDIVIWLYPLVDGEPVHHHPGPFDGVRLEYNVLRSPARVAEHYLRCVQQLGDLGCGVLYRSRQTVLGRPPNLTPVREDIAAIVQHWAGQGITVGSDAALEIDV